MSTLLLAPLVLAPLVLVSLEPLLALPSLLALAVVPSVLLQLGPLLALLLRDVRLQVDLHGCRDGWLQLKRVGGDARRSGGLMVRILSRSAHPRYIYM